MRDATTQLLTPVTDVKRHATEIIGRLRENRIPVLVTEHGRGAAVILDIASYDELMGRLAILEGIACGERAFAEGRVVSHSEAKKRLSRWVDEHR